MNAGNLDRYLFPEENILRGDFRGYFLAKRVNFMAAINNFQDLADLYLYVDEAWLDAIGCLKHLHEGSWIVPTQLTIFCFRELRLAAEFLFCGCTTPGYSHLRTAIESFAQAQKIMREPVLSRVWLSRDEDRQGYNKHFKANLKNNLFPVACGFAHLHRIWQMLCDAGPHPNLTSIGISSSFADAGSDINWQLNFFEVNFEELSKNLLLLLKCSLEMLKFTFNAFHSKLSQHPTLLSKTTSHLARYEVMMRKYGPKQHS